MNNDYNELVDMFSFEILKKLKFAVAWSEAISVAGGGLVNFGFFKIQFSVCFSCVPATEMASHHATANFSFFQNIVVK